MSEKCPRCATEMQPESFIPKSVRGNIVCFKCGSRQFPKEFRQAEGCRIRELENRIAELEDGILAELQRHSDTESEDVHPLDGLVKNRTYCHACSVAGGADMPIHHLPPACS